MIDVSSMPWLHTVFMIAFCVIGAGCILGLVYGALSRRFTDKLVAVNLITTLSLNAICMLAILLREDYVLDVALIYALLGFAAIVVLCKLMTVKNRKEK